MNMVASGCDVTLKQCKQDTFLQGIVQQCYHESRLVPQWLNYHIYSGKLNIIEEGRKRGTRNDLSVYIKYS